MASPLLGKNKICVVCGNIFYASRARKKRGDALKYCSRKCYMSTRSIKYHRKICEYCGQYYKIKIYELWRGKGSTFCSQDCWHHSCKNGGDYLKQERHKIKYRNWRIEVLKRDNYTCQECGQLGGNLQTHHILTVFQYPHLMTDVDNGMTLCYDCHKLKHKRVVKGKYWAWELK